MLEAVNLSLVEKLAKLAESCLENPPCAAVILIQRDSSGLCSNSWFGELAGKLLFDSLVERIKSFRSVLRDIRLSKIPWIYATRTDCYDTFFELSQACHTVLCFESSVRMGYPSLSSGAFPIGGIFEQMVAKDRKFAESWSLQPVKPARDLVRLGLVAFAIDKKNQWERLARQWTEGNLGRLKPRSGRSLSFPRLNFFRRDQNEVFLELKAALKKSNLKAAFDVGVEISQKGDLKDERVIRLLIEESSRHLLSTAYTTWAYQRIISTYPASSSRDSRFTQIRVLFEIVLEDVLPPSELIAKILYQGDAVLLLASDTDLLLPQVEVLYGKLRKRMDDLTRDQLWDKAVFWAVGVPSGKNLVLTTLPYNRLILNDGANSVSFQFFLGSGNFAESMAELPDSALVGKSDSEVSRAIGHISLRSIVEIPLGKQQMSLSDFLLSRVFEEIMKTGIEQGVALDALFFELGEQGWGRITKSIEWERFLSTRHNLYSHDSTEYKVGPFELDPIFWEISNLKEAQALMSDSHRMSEAVYTTDLTHRLVVLCGLIAHAIWMERRVPNFGDADLLCAAVVGFPSKHPSPLIALRKLGPARVKFEFFKVFSLSEGSHGDLAAVPMDFGLC